MREKTFCRCCLSEECYKDIANLYYIGNKTENYFDMLLNIFNIKLSMEDNHRCFICEGCVSKLRDAAAFKTRVLNTQEILNNHLNWNDNKTAIDSLLNHNTDDEEYDDFDDTLSDKFNDSYFVWDDRNEAHALVITLEPIQGTQNISKETIHNLKRKRKSNNNEKNKDENIQNISTNSNELDGATDTSTSVASIVNDNNNYKEVLTTNTTTVSNGDGTPHSNTKRTLAKKLKTRSVSAKQRKGKLNRSKTNQLDTQTQIIPKHKRENTLKLILNSNLCLFRSFRNKYGCMYCNTKFLEFNQLREHSLNHFDTKSLVRKVNCLKGLSCKNAEISNLKCSKCNTNCTDLLELLNHLKNEHEMLFHGTDHYLVPYKLENGFQCVSCDSKFKSYLRLSIHMNTHYTNNVCEMCGVSFINRLGLRAHVQMMHKEKKCSHCPALFLTNSLKMKHLRQVHDNVQNWKRHCNLCDQTFRYTYLLDEHKIQEHGVKRQIKSCPECGKSFPSAANLKIHLRSVHIKERNYPCSTCSMRFFTKCDQKRHERTHEDIRSFACNYCEGKFKSKDSWRRHMKRQHGHVFGKES